MLVYQVNPAHSIEHSRVGEREKKIADATFEQISGSREDARTIMRSKTTDRITFNNRRHKGSASRCGSGYP